MVFLAFVLGGCASTRTVMAPDGRPAYIIKCGDSAKCYARAQKVCPRGYVVMDSDRSEGFVVLHNSGISTVSPRVRREVLIRCRDRLAEEE